MLVLQAGAFTVIEETAIAKGVRRIVAVTRQAAIDALGAAEALREEFGSARALPVSALPKAIADLTDRLNTAVIPAAARLELRNQLADLQAASTAAWKEAQRARTDAAVAAAQAAAEAAQQRAVSTGKPGFVVVEVCANSSFDLCSRSFMDFLRLNCAVPSSRVLLVH
jgi:alanyl-tRNA synthetase